MIKLWVDDKCLAPEGYIHCKNIEKALYYIHSYENLIHHLEWERDTADFDNLYKHRPKPIVKNIDKMIEKYTIEVIDIGEIGVKLLEWLISTNRSYPICFHYDWRS